MGLLARWKLARTLRRTESLLASGQGEEGLALLEQLASAHGTSVHVLLADRLTARGRLEEARRLLHAGLTREPAHWNARVSLAELEERDGNAAEAITHFRELLTSNPGHLGLRHRLARLLLAKDEAAADVEEGVEPPEEHAGALEAADLLLQHRDKLDLDGLHLLGKALFAAHRTPEALDVLSAVVGEYDRQAKNAFFNGGVDPVAFEEARALHATALAEVEGDEALTEDAARRGNLAARAGVNYRLLAHGLMVRSACVAPSLSLLSPRETAVLGERILAEGGATDVARAGAGYCQLGIAALRMGDAEEALAHFTRAREADPSHFGALAGYGAALDQREHGLWRRARKLPGPEAWPGLVEVVQDWDALSPEERRVVCASVAPLRFILPQLAREGRRIRVLPLDVRPVDVPEFGELVGVRHDDDHRSYASLEGLAGHELACAKVEGLLDTREEGWTFAHEFAHLAHAALPEEDQVRLEALYTAACEAEHAFTQYQLTNPHELFAVAYTEFLCLQHGGSEHIPLDQVPEAGDLLAFLHELERRAA